MLSYFADSEKKQDLRKTGSMSSGNLMCTHFKSLKSAIKKGVLWCIE